MKLDKYWTYEKGMPCPLCKHIGLWYDNHDEKDATHYCKKCNQGITIIGSCAVRGGKE